MKQIKNVVYPYDGILVSHKKNEILTRDMDELETLHYVKEARSQKTIYSRILVILKSRVGNSTETEGT